MQLNRPRSCFESHDACQIFYYHEQVLLRLFSTVDLLTSRALHFYIVKEWFKNLS